VKLIEVLDYADSTNSLRLSASVELWGGS